MLARGAGSAAMAAKAEVEAEVEVAAATNMAAFLAMMDCSEQR